MSAWTHPICEVCWAERYGARLPHRLAEPGVERCCYCGADTSSGIYVRDDPASVPDHREHEE